MRKPQVHWRPSPKAAASASLMKAGLVTHNAMVALGRGGLASASGRSVAGTVTGTVGGTSSRRQPRSSSGILTCKKCQSKSDAATWSDKKNGAPYGPSCGECKSIYDEGNFSVEGSFEAVADLCRDREKTTAARWEAATANRANKGGRPFVLEAVNGEDAMKLVISESWIGVSGKQYKELTSNTAESAGIKMLDLPGSKKNSKKFKGFLARNPQQPYVTYTLVREIAVRKSRQHMLPSSHLHEDQGDLVQEQEV